MAQPIREDSSLVGDIGQDRTALDDSEDDEHSLQELTCCLSVS